MDTSDRLLRWATELSEYDMEFYPRTAIKAQALEDFVIKGAYLEEETETPAIEIVDYIFLVGDDTRYARNRNS